MKKKEFIATIVFSLTTLLPTSIEAQMRQKPYLDDFDMVISVYSYFHCLINEGFIRRRDLNEYIKPVMDLLESKWGISKERQANILELDRDEFYEYSQEHVFKNGGCKKIIKENRESLKRKSEM